MTNQKKASDEELVSAYSAERSIYRVAEQFGMCPQTVHERLGRLGVDTSMNVFTDEDKALLESDYLIYRDAGKLQQLADRMGRTKHFICRQARALGLTDKAHKRAYLAKWECMSGDTALVIWEDFKSSRKNLKQYCEAKGYGEIGFWKTMRDYFGDEWDHVIELKRPRQSLYGRGRAFEYKVRDNISERGYFVLRSPASRSPADLVAISKRGVLMIQCKIGRAMGVVEWNSLYDLAIPNGATPLLAYPGNGGRGIEIMRLVDRKDGSKRTQPMEAFVFPEQS